MASRKCNEAVDAYRKAAKAQFKAELADRILATHVVGLDSTDMGDYVRMTADIDAALSRVEQALDDQRYAPSTVSQMFSREMNAAGQDRES